MHHKVLSGKHVITHITDFMKQINLQATGVTHFRYMQNPEFFMLGCVFLLSLLYFAAHTYINEQ